MERPVCANDNWGRRTNPHKVKIDNLFIIKYDNRSESSFGNGLFCFSWCKDSDYFETISIYQLKNDKSEGKKT
jgi:hypothetical protein